MLIETSVSAGTATSAASLSTVPWIGRSTEALPPKVSGRSVAACTDEPLVLSAIDAAPIVTGAEPIALENFTRTWSPPTVAQTICRTVGPAAVAPLAAWTGAAQVGTQLLRASAAQTSAAGNDEEPAVSAT